ncbi:DUF433 domain-containing protein [Nostoc sp. JL31]|nr:DUF433 domain-containing protein [Nostoc sp. JL31]
MLPDNLIFYQVNRLLRKRRTPVRAIVENWRLGIRPEEIPLHLPHLTLA